MISAISSDEAGVVSDGLSTMVLPAARAGRPLPHRHHHRVVPRRDRCAHADRLPSDERGVVLQVLAGRLALEVAGRAGEEADLVDQRGDLLGQGHGDRLAGVLALDRAPGPLPVASSASAMRKRARLRSDGVASRHPGKAAAAAAMASIDVLGPGHRGLEVLLAGAGIDQHGRWSRRRSPRTCRPRSWTRPPPSPAPSLAAH